MNLSERVAASLVGAALAFAGGCASDDIAVVSAPPAVQKTIDQFADGGAVHEMEMEKENGRTFYQADVRKPDGTKIEITVTEDGKLYRLETESE